MANGTNGGRRSLLSLSRQEWSQLRAAAPEIDDILRRECNIVGRQALFDAAGRPTPLLAVRLKSLRSQGARSIMDCLSGHLLHLLTAIPADDESGDDESGDVTAGEAGGGGTAGGSDGALGAGGESVSVRDEEKAHDGDPVDEGGRALADGSAEMAVEAGGHGQIAGGRGAALAGGIGSGAAAPDSRPADGDLLDRAQELIAGLRERHAPALAAVTRIRSRVESGMPADGGDLTELLGWQEDLAAACGLLGLDAQDGSLSRLDEAAAQAIAARLARSEQARLSGLLAAIAAITAEGTRAPLDQVVARAAALSGDAREQAEIAGEDRAAFQALYRIMTAGTVAAVDPDDANVAVEAFGMGAFLAAVGALASGTGSQAEGAAPPREWQADAAVARAEQETPAPELSFPLSWLIPAAPAAPEAVPTAPERAEPDPAERAEADLAERAEHDPAERAEAGLAERAEHDPAERTEPDPAERAGAGLAEAAGAAAEHAGTGQPQTARPAADEVRVRQLDLGQDLAEEPEGAAPAAWQVAAGQSWTWRAAEEAASGRGEEPAAGEADARQAGAGEAGPGQDEQDEAAAAAGPAAELPDDTVTADPAPGDIASYGPVPDDMGPGDIVPGDIVPGDIVPGEPLADADREPAAVRPAGAAGEAPAESLGEAGGEAGGEAAADEEAPGAVADAVPGPEPAGVPDSRIVAAVRDGRPGLAYWYSVALRLPGPVQDALEVAALAEAVAADGDEASTRIREILGGYRVEALAQDPCYIPVLAGGSARALLRMPFSPCAGILLECCDRLPAGRDRSFLEAVLQAGTYGFDLSRLDDVQARSIDDYVRQRDEARKHLEHALDTALHTTIRYPRATDVLRSMMEVRGRIGGVVTAVLAATDELGQGEALLSDLRDQKSVDRLINDTDARLNPVAARRSKIIGPARERVRTGVAEVLDSLRCYLEACRALESRRRSGNPNLSLDAAVRELNGAALAADGAEPAAREQNCGDGGQGPDDLGSYAIDRVRRWTRDVLARLPQALAARQSPLETDLVRAFEVTRSEDGEVDPASVTPELLDACLVRSAQDAYEGFAEAYDFAGIERLIDTLRAEGDTATADRLADSRAEDVKIGRERLKLLADKADKELAFALFAALVSESESAYLGSVLVRYRNPLDDDFPAARRALAGIVQQVAAARDRAIEKARAQLSELACADEVRRRIGDLLDLGDLVTAQEFLAQLTAGSYGLPAETATDETFGEFWPDFIDEAVTMASRGDGIDASWLEQAAREHRTVAWYPLLPPDAGQAVEQGLNGWLLLTRERRGGTWQRSLKEVLYLLGFETRGPVEDSSRMRRSGQAVAKFKAKLVGRALVPAYGSSADGDYQVLLCWGRQEPDRIIEMVEDLPRQAPVIVLLFSTMTARDRRVLAEQSRAKSTSAVVIDHAVMAFLATRSAARLQTTMSLTLPFTAINPYTPFVLGDVPREVFYGRRDELRDVQDANGPLFVYGGRQLGKSTLLKTAMREFNETAGQWRSIYIDLKSEGIGELRVPDDLWSVLIPRLKQAGILDQQKVSAKAGPDVVVSAIRSWLDEDQDRRFLLLLDEADAFLEIDARPRPEQVGEGRFVNVYRLKNLMDGSGRRFKPVFAGLHQVQRFNIVSNGPMAHVGAEILIGPLPASEAYKLVVEPLAAIGYRFERTDIAWRLLAYTNYQASLIQAFCNALVRRMHDRRLGPDAPPAFITDRDIDEVYGERDLRDWIASRFELTINLDNRYRVIAYAAAWMTNETSATVFPVGMLHDECKTFWRAGFQGLNLDDFTTYLDELVGLGVLVRTTDDEYGIRSPNVIRLLGSPAEIERRLMESDGVLEVSTLFDPAVFRRKLGDDPDRRSPLTEQQVQQILDSRRQLHVIVGSPALGLDRVADALTVAAPEGTEVRAVTCATLNATVTSLSQARRGRQHIVLDLAGASELEQRSALKQVYTFVSGIDRRSASCLASPGTDWIWTDGLPGVRFQEVRLRVWDQDTLRAWAPECQYPLSTADQRQRLLDDTGGWPYLVEWAAGAARRGLSDQRAREEALRQLDAAAQEFLASVEIPDDPVTADVLRALVDWSDEIGFEGIATLVSADPDAVLGAITRLLDLGVLSNAASEDSYRVNPLIVRLLREP